VVVTDGKAVAKLSAAPVVEPEVKATKAVKPAAKKEAK
jgi:hypothetical protein